MAADVPAAGACYVPRPRGVNRQARATPKRIFLRHEAEESTIGESAVFPPFPEISMARSPRKHRTVKKDDYSLSFYPGFLREGRVETGGEEVVLYRQRKPYDIRGRPDEPLANFSLRLAGGPNDRDVTLRIEDPQHSIAQIVVRFHPRGYTPGSREETGPDETATFENTPVLCPPICEDDGDGEEPPSRTRARKPRG